MTELKWKRGNRVRYIASHCARLNGQIGTVTGRDDRGWLRVRFDFQESYEKGTQVADSSLEPFTGNQAEADAKSAAVLLLRACNEADDLTRSIARIKADALTVTQRDGIERASSLIRQAHATLEAAR